MTAHVLYRALDPEAPATLSSAVIQRVLREEFGYDGLHSTFISLISLLSCLLL